MRKVPVAFQALLSVLLVMPLGAQAPQRGVALPSRPASAGAYYALIIGINAYQHENHLQTAVADAKAIDELLRQRYGFQTNLLLDGDATRDNILGAFGQYRRTLNENDSFLIYYAGHGIRDGDKAYWLPVNADPDSSAHWIISDEVAKSVSVLPSRHVLLVSNSCFSGGLSRGDAPRRLGTLPIPCSAVGSTTRFSAWFSMTTAASPDFWTAGIGRKRPRINIRSAGLLPSTPTQWRPAEERLRATTTTPALEQSAGNGSRMKPPAL